MASKGQTLWRGYVRFAWNSPCGGLLATYLTFAEPTNWGKELCKELSTKSESLLGLPAQVFHASTWEAKA